MHIKMSENEIKAACAEWLDAQLPDASPVGTSKIVLEVNARGEVALTVDVEVEE